MIASPQIDSLRRACERARLEYLAAQYRLLGRLFAANAWSREWPSAKEYEAAAELGKAASLASRSYLDGLNVPRQPARSAAERMHLIHRLSADERMWQPSPADWLKQQGIE